MKTEFLTNLGLEQDVIQKIMAENGKDINPLKEKIKEHEATIAELNGKITGLSETSQEVETLKKKVADYEEMEKNRKLEEEKAKENEIFLKNIDEIIGSRKFVNEITKNGIIEVVKGEMEKSENKNLGLKDVFENVVKEKADIWQNPNQNVVIKKVGNSDATSLKAQMDEYYKDNPFYNA